MCLKNIFMYLVLFANVWGMSANLEGNTTTQPKGSLAVIIKVEGKAKILSASSIKKRTVLADTLLFQGDKLITYADSTIIIKLADGSKLVLNEDSALTFVDEKSLIQGSGEVYYKIQRRAHLSGLTVKTPFSIIGIKGTEFIVEAKGKAGVVALNEGLIGIESLQAAFELHKQKIMSEYEAFKNRQMQGFEAYKAQADKEVVNYVKAFDLHASKLLRFTDASGCREDCESRVDESDFTDTTAQRFASYQAMIQE